MANFLQRLKQRKLVQWALAYLAAAWVLLQVLDLASGSYHWPDAVMHIAFGALAVGFVVALILAWYHGERGAQRVSGMELLIVALVLALGGGLLWHFAREPVQGAAANTVAIGHGTVAAALGTTTAVTSAKAVPASALTSPIAAQPVPAKSVAVLPFENLSTDKGNAYFADGMQDLILTKLADIGDLKVISRTSTMKYASHPDDLKTIGQQLGVATILEGSVQKAGNQVLINVQLIDAKTDGHIWAQSYQRTLDNIFGIEGEVADKVATALQAKLSPQEAAALATALSNNPIANDLYLGAEYLTRRGGPAAWKQALPLFRQALALAPDFALARARLSYAESNLAWFGGGGEDVEQLHADARAQAAQALKLAPNLPEAHLALGYCDYYGKGDYAAALKAFVTVVKLRPNDADALRGQGAVLRRLGRFDEAIAAFQQAVALNPRDVGLARMLGSSYALVSRWPEAEAAYRRALLFDPGANGVKSWLAQAILLAHGDVPAALAEAAGDASGFRGTRARFLTYQRKYGEALALLDALPDPSGNGAFMRSPKALRQARLYDLLGEPARAHALYVTALPQARSMLAAAAGVTAYEAFAWNNVAAAELGLGETGKALAALAKSQALIAKADDHVYGPSFIERNAAVYAGAGRPDLAVPLLAKALAMPGIGWSYSPVMLWLDPDWDPIRRTPAFQALLDKYARFKPAVIPVAPPRRTGDVHD